MKKLMLFLSIGFYLIVRGQGAEKLIPPQAVTVFSINNTDLLQKVSIDEWITYDFMEEIHQELFDKSTDNKTVKDAGLDFDKRLSLFYGKTSSYELTGFTFGIKDQSALFKVFDDFEEVPSNFPGVNVYQSLFNNLLIDQNNGLLIRVEPTESFLNQQTDSLWYDRGNLSPFYSMDEDEYMEEEELELEDAQKSLLEKNYFELRDSLQFEFQKKYYAEVLNSLLVQKKSLYSNDSTFRELLTHASAGVFYLDNSRNIDRSKNLWYLKTVLPSLYLDVQELYEGNIITGDLILKESAIQFDLKAAYSEPLGSIYSEMNRAKFDKNIAPFIRANQPAYFSYTINLQSAYEKAFEVLVPILSKAKDPEISFNLLMLKLGNALVNKEALFDAYKGSLFVTFNGIQKVKTRKITFFYDEQTFEYGERETEAEEDMPIFTLGFSTRRQDIPEMILEHLSQVTSKFEKKSDYWIYQKAIFDAAPVFLINAKGMFLLTNDQDLAENHREGYGTEALSKRTIANLKKSGTIAGYANLQEVALKFPSDFLEPSQRQLMEFLRNKTGSITIKSGKTTLSSTSLHVNYLYNDAEKSGKHFLDLLNTLYLLTK
ncbi:MAG: hypothetical protein FJZ80_07495 [Bacteroidetes bacterium]|nr:hypothetical protein [Bacteroidota bacterium]